MLAAYRRRGADLPFGDPRRPHDVAMEGWFWRITHAASGTVVVVLSAVSRHADGRRWGTLGLAVHPGGFSRTVVARDVTIGPAGELTFGTALRTTPRTVDVDLGEGARLAVELEPVVPWPRRAFGGIGVAQTIPGLSQYWHPWLLRGRVTGTLEADGRRVDLGGSTVYAEKNWSPGGGFPERWWWGQAHAFADDALCVAFAGGTARLGRLHAEATALVIADGDRVRRLVHPGLPLRVAVGGDRWLLRGRSRDGARVEVEGQAGAAPPHRLPVPLPADGRHHPDAAAQHLAGELHVLVTRRGRTLVSDTSRLAGLEVGEGVPLGQVSRSGDA